MDPHMTKEDYNYLSLESDTHRHLRQRLSPPTQLPTKKKKLVNFKLNRRKGVAAELEPLQDQTINNRNYIVHSHPVKDNIDERYKENEDVTNFNVVKKSTSRINVDDSTSPPANGNIPSDWSLITENQRPNLNQITSTNTTSKHRKTRYIECVPLTIRRSSSSSSYWDRVRNRRSRRGSITTSPSLYSVVNNAVNKRKSTPAPCIWTPSVPRSQPTPRSGNWKEQEEPGSGSYLFSFVCSVLHAKTKQQIKQMKYHSSPYYQESQSPRQRKKHVEFYGKTYTQWLTDILTQPSFREGHLMKGLEIGVQFPVVHMSPVIQPKNNSRCTSSDSTSSTHFGLRSDAILTQGVYKEVVSWVPELLVTCPSDPSQWARCFIVIGFKTLDGDFSKVEVQWREWTGAKYIYFNICDDLGLKKLSFYRRKSRHEESLFTYIVVVEVDTVTKGNVLYLLDFVYRMRLKGMGGYISVYQERSPPKLKKNNN